MSPFYMSMYINIHLFDLMYVLVYVEERGSEMNIIRGLLNFLFIFFLNISISKWLFCFIIIFFLLGQS